MNTGFLTSASGVHEIRAGGRGLRERREVVTTRDDLNPQDHDKVRGSRPAGSHLDLPDADVTFFPHFFGVEESDRFLDELYRTTGWRQEAIKKANATIPLTRLTAWYGDPSRTYTYSGITMEPQPWTEPLLEIKARIEQVWRAVGGALLPLRILADPKLELRLEGEQPHDVDRVHRRSSSLAPDTPSPSLLITDGRVVTDLGSGHVDRKACRGSFSSAAVIAHSVQVIRRPFVSSICAAP